MRLPRSCVWLPAIILVAIPQLLALQVDQATENSTTAAKKAKAKAKKAEPSGEATGESAAGTTAKRAATKTENGVPQTPETPKTRKARAGTTGTAQRAMPTVSGSEIAAAKASGKVWVNTETGVYHKGGQWYGATKQGKFMTEDEAIKSGYHASKSK